MKLLTFHIRDVMFTRCRRLICNILIQLSLEFKFDLSNQSIQEIHSLKPRIKLCQGKIKLSGGLASALFYFISFHIFCVKFV